MALEKIMAEAMKAALEGEGYTVSAPDAPALPEGVSPEVMKALKNAGYTVKVPEKPVTQQPVAQQPVTQQPVAQQPVAQQPVAQQPVTQQPVTQQPVTQQPVTQQPVTKQPDAQQKQEVVHRFVLGTPQDGAPAALDEGKILVMSVEDVRKNMDGIKGYVVGEMAKTGEKV